MGKTVVGRFAPSPSGYMHMGNLLAMLLAWLDVRAQNGRLIFRMEDLDPARSKRAYMDALADDLRWLGLDWDGGYPAEDYMQSRRGLIYEEAFTALRENGLVYPCFCTRAERLASVNAPHEGDRIFDPGCRCAHMTEAEQKAMAETGRRPAWKIRVPDKTVTITDDHYGAFSQNIARDGGDFIIRRADGVFAYQLAVSVDDMLMGVTRVVRGRDLLPSAPKQKWIIETLGGTAPDYCHAPLITSGAGKLSKRLGSMSTEVFRKSMAPEVLLGRLAHLCGITPNDAPISAGELIPLFDWNKIPLRDIQIQ